MPTADEKSDWLEADAISTRIREGKERSYSLDDLEQSALEKIADKNP